MPSQALRASRPSRMSRPPCSDARPRRATAAGPRPDERARRRAPPRRPRPPPAASTSARATAARAERPGSGRPARPGPRRAPRRRPAAPRPTSLHVAAVADPAVDVAHDPAGQRDVEEQRAVVGRHRRRAATGRRRDRRRRSSSARRSTPWSAPRCPSPPPAPAPSIVRMPWRNGPVPRRQTRTASTSAGPTSAAPRPQPSGSCRHPLGSRALRSRRPLTGCGAAGTESRTPTRTPARTRSSAAAPGRA